MATVTVTRRWPDGDLVQVSVEVDRSYPDELDQAKRTAIDGFAAAMGVALTPVDDE